MDIGAVTLSRLERRQWRNDAMRALLPKLSLRLTATVLTFLVAGALAVLTVLMVKNNLDRSYLNTAGLLASARARTAGDAVGTEMAELTADLQAVRSAIEQFGLSSDQSRVQAWLESIQRSKGEYTWIGIADGTGTVIVGTHGQKVGINESGTAWFKGGRSGLYYGSLRPSTLLKKDLAPLPSGEPWHFVDIALPLAGSASGQVLAVHLSWPWLRQRLTSVDAAFPPDSDLWLLGPDDHPWLGQGAVASQTVSLSAVNWARQGKAGWTVETWPDGLPYITGYSPATASYSTEGVHWVTLVRRRADVWPASIQRQFDAVASLAGALVLLVTGCVWIASTVWLRPLRRFALEIGKTPEGERPPEPPGHLPKEFQWLNEAVLALVDRLNAKEAAVRQALAEVRHSFRAVGSSIPGVLATFRVTPAGTLQFTYVSETCERYYGVAHDVLLNEPLAWSTHADDGDVQALGRAFVRLLFGGGRVLTRPVKFRGADGQQRTLQLTIIQRDVDDERVFDSISLDITDLLRARSEAERAERAKSEFLASMSHELRTPLNAVLGMSRALEEGASQAEQRLQARLLRESSETLTRTVNDLLEIAKIDAGTFELAPRAFSLDEVVESSAHAFRAIAAERKIEFQLKAPHNTPMLVGDPVRLRQILHNLLSNAFESTPSGQVSVSVKLTDAGERARAARRPAHVRISVADTIGMGVHQGRGRPGRAQHDQRSGRPPAGSGLGLAIVKWLVERMGGTISLKTTGTYGSELSVVIPLELATTATSTDDGGARAGEPPLTVLVADDYDINRHVLRALLEQRGHVVLEAEDGLQAVDLARTMRPDVVLMDVDMPQLDGLDATRRIRAMPGQEGLVPIFALTGKTFPEDIERVAASGMDGHLCKPIELDELVGVLQKAAQARSTHSHTASA